MMMMVAYLLAFRMNGYANLCPLKKARRGALSNDCIIRSRTHRQHLA